MRKTPKIIVSLMLTAAMTVSIFSSVLAEESVDVQTENVKVVETEEPAAEEPAVFSEPESEQQDKPLSAESEEVVVKDEDTEKLTAEDIVNGGMSPDVVVESLGDVCDYAAPISKDDYTITRYSNRVTIRNNVAKTTDTSKDLYAIILYKDESKQKKTLYWGTRIETGTELPIYHVHDEKGYETPIGSEGDFTVLLGREYTWEGMEESDLHFGIIGWETDDEGKVTPYNIEDTFDIPASSIHEDTPTQWKDGYTGIRMAATVTANLQIKVTWSPNGKDEKQKTYKKYKLYELIEDSSSETGYREEQRWPLDKNKKPADAPSTSKSATLNVDIDQEDLVLNSSLLYMLKCYDADGTTVLDQYVSPVAPYALEIQTGYDIKCTQPKENKSMAYRFQLAKVNKDNDGKKITEGFQDDWSSDTFFNEMYSIGDYPVKKKTVKAVELTYSRGEPDIALGKAVYGRVRTVAFLNDLVAVSAPSNVLSCKYGPETCYVVDIAGVRYDPADAKNNSNEQNIIRAQKHWARINEKDPGDFEWEDVYLHCKDAGTCAKSGMVFFVAPKDESDIKAYDLLRSDKKNGVYKKIKTYAKGAKDLLSVGTEEYSGMPVYAMQYTSFVPETEYYYAVRAVSKTGNTPGSRWEGFANTTTCDAVQHMELFEADQTMIALIWKHDDCAKQYWLYREKTKIDNVDEYLAKRPTPIAKISGSSFKKITEEGETYQYHLYYDKKVDTDQEYFYFVRPMYNMKKSTDPTYNKDLCSQVVRGKATAKFARVKNFTGSNYSIRNILLSFSQTQRLTQYRIFRLKVKENVKTLPTDWQPNIYDEYDPDKETAEQFEERIDGWSLDNWKTFMAKKHPWEYVDTITGDGKSTKKKTYNDVTVNVGDCYYYLIQGATDKSASFLFSYTKQIQNLPLPPAGFGGSWSGSGSGIRLKWGLNSKDKSYASDIVFEFSKDKGQTWTIESSGVVDKTLKRGKEREYWVRVVFDNDGTPVCSNIAKTKCSLPSRIEVDDYREIYVGDEISIGGNAVKDDGGTASVHDISYSKMDGALKGSGGHYTADHEGDAWVTLRCAGISKDVHVKVRKRQ